MKDKAIIGCVHRSTETIGAEHVLHMENMGMDALLIIDDVKPEDEEGLIKWIKAVHEQSAMPLLIKRPYNRLEDVKKILYAGDTRAVIDKETPENLQLIQEAKDRFGMEKILAWPSPALVVKNISDTDQIAEVLKDDNICGLISDRFHQEDTNLLQLKHDLGNKGIATNRFESSVPFSEFKLNSDGLIPVVTQEYKTGEVLMVAYMNEEAFNETLRSGRMTYWSRSRQELWKKGDTSGHFQYVKSLDIDCDKDTILAKVVQIGAACHTGNRSCFFTNLVSTPYDTNNPTVVFDEVMKTILQRKTEPKEGSYTNYLFDKGIDKILKKIGEEATEIVIAAKNPDSDELIYEICDFLYHMMVLMAEKGVSWKEITKELADRH